MLRDEGLHKTGASILDRCTSSAGGPPTHEVVLVHTSCACISDDCHGAWGDPWIEARMGMMGRAPPHGRTRR